MFPHAGRVLALLACGAGHDYSVRQLRDMKSTIDLYQLAADGLEAHAAVCAGVLARAHACSGDAALIGGYLGRGGQFDNAIAAFAESYADRVEADHAALVKAIEKGSVRAIDDGRSARLKRRFDRRQAPRRRRSPTRR